LTIVTNENLAHEVKKNGGSPFVLEDKTPVFDSLTRIKLKGKYNLTFICTFEKDEPYQEVIKGASLIDPSICIYVTGEYEKAAYELRKFALPNLVFTGFLSDRDYKNLLFSSDVIMDLTLMRDCLVCGAYEAVALGKPMILSNTEALKAYFSMGAVYTENTAKAIAVAITTALETKDKLQEEVIKLRTQLQRKWQKKLAQLLTIMAR
jgi:glycosyltransferase involved in cell wall biosynthesis